MDRPKLWGHGDTYRVRGVALLELAIVLPLLLLLIFAIYELGSNLSHIARVNQVAYSAALRGAGIGEAGRNESTADIALQLYDASLQNPLALAATPIATPSYDSGQRLVTVYFNEGYSGFVNPFFIDLPVSLSVTLPWLVEPLGNFSDQFFSPFPPYCPNGQVCVSEPPTPTPGADCRQFPHLCCYQYGVLVNCSGGTYGGGGGYY